MHRKVIYQALAFVPVVAAAAAPNVSVAFSSTSHQLINRTVIYEDKSTFIAPPPEIITVDKWYAPLERPTRERRRITEQQVFAAPPQAAPGNYGVLVQTTTHQLLSKSIVYEESAYTAFTPSAAETVTVDKWWMQLATPIRIRVAVDKGQYSAAPPLPQANDAIGWYRPLELPTRRKLVTAEEGSIFASPPRTEANDAVGWHRQLDWPTRRKVIVEGAYSAAPPKPEAKDQVSWWRDLDIPTRLKRLPVTAGLSFTGAAPGAGTEYNWFSGIDLPTRLKRSLQSDLSYSYFPADVVVETVTIDKWWRELAQPVRRRQITAEEGSIFGAPPLPQANDAIGWYAPLEAPTRAKRLPQGAIPFEAKSGFPVVPWGWYAELDKPVRLAKTPSNQIGYAFVAAAPSNATAQQTWHQLDTPTRARRLYEFPATAIPTYFVPAVAGPGNELNWWPALNEPVRPRLSVKTAQQQGLTIAPRLLTTTLENAWHQRLSEPVRLKVTFGKYPGGTVQGNLNPIVATSFAPLDRPTRIRGSLYAQQTFSYSYRLIELVTVDKWWRQLDVPTRKTPPDQQHKWALAPFQFTAPGTGTSLIYTISHQLLQRTVIYEEHAYAPPKEIIPTGIGGPADEHERVACVPAASREAVVPSLLREVSVPLEVRVATVPALSRVVETPLSDRDVNSNEYRDRTCGTPPEPETTPPVQVPTVEEAFENEAFQDDDDAFQ